MGGGSRALGQDDSELVLDVDDEVDEDELVVVFLLFESVSAESLLFEPESLFESESSELFDSDFSLAPDERPFADADEDERESVIYQPLPLNTMPTG